MRRWVFAVLVLLNLGLLLWGIQFIEQQRPNPPEAQAPINLDKMRLISELPKDKLAARVKAPVTPPPSPSTDVSMICYRMGPFTDQDTTAKVESLLKDGPKFVRVTEAQKKVTGYRVYLPSFKTKELAERKRRELTKLGFRDHSLMQEEGMQNAISLGLFAVEANAQAHVRELAQKGIKAKVDSVEQLQTLYWLDLAPTPASSETRTRLGSLLEGISGPVVYEMPCPTVPVAPDAAAAPVR